MGNICLSYNYHELSLNSKGIQEGFILLAFLPLYRITCLQICFGVFFGGGIDMFSLPKNMYPLFFMCFKVGHKVVLFSARRGTITFSSKQSHAGVLGSRWRQVWPTSRGWTTSTETCAPPTSWWETTRCARSPTSAWPGSSRTTNTRLGKVGLPPHTHTHNVKGTWCDCIR